MAYRRCSHEKSNPTVTLEAGRGRTTGETKVNRESRLNLLLRSSNMAPPKIKIIFELNRAPWLGYPVSRGTNRTTGCTGLFFLFLWLPKARLPRLNITLLIPSSCPTKAFSSIANLQLFLRFLSFI
ncbi:UNVERIFIED_CONTAM: hypothetical protein RMT77_016124 [Armadillidium vulgare]